MKRSANPHTNLLTPPQPHTESKIFPLELFIPGERECGIPHNTVNNTLFLFFSLLFILNLLLPDICITCHKYIRTVRTCTCHKSIETYVSPVINISGQSGYVPVITQGQNYQIL